MGLAVAFRDMDLTAVVDVEPGTRLSNSFGRLRHLTQTEHLDVEGNDRIGLPRPDNDVDVVDAHEPKLRQAPPAVSAIAARVFLDRRPQMSPVVVRPERVL